MKKEITFTFSVENGLFCESVTSNLGKIAEEFGVVFFKEEKIFYEWDDLSEEAKNHAVEEHINSANLS